MEGTVSLVTLRSTLFINVSFWTKYCDRYSERKVSVDTQSKMKKIKLIKFGVCEYWGVYRNQ